MSGSLYARKQYSQRGGFHVANPLDKQLERWISARVVDASTAARIRRFEESQGSSERLRWPVLLAVALGGVLLCAGVLLFVAAHWDELSPAWRFALVMILVGVFPIAAALTEEKFPALSTTFYAIGTVCVGAGIFLTAQIFNLQEHWPSGILMWAIGALAVLPLSLWAFVEGRGYWGWWQNRPPVSSFLQITGWAIAICGPLALAYALRKKAAWTNAVAAVWVLVIGTFHARNGNASDKLPIFAWNSLGPYFWAGVGALGMVAWGLVERRRERINLGVAGFALTVIIFYFSDVMDKLGRSASLIGLGVLFLLGGWALERTRRQLVARVAGGTL